MISALKKQLYFPLAWYFRIFAERILHQWDPKIIVITGSSGKTTIMHLVETQLKQHARFTHKANSSYGIPFDLLGINRTTFFNHEWLTLFLKAPFAHPSVPTQKLFVVEADCDRPYEGTFLATLLKPHITLWMNSSRTHSAQFDDVVQNGAFPSIEKAVAHEFSQFVAHTSERAIINGDNDNIALYLSKTRADVDSITAENLQSWSLHEAHGTFYTTFRVFNQKITLPFLLPKNVWYGIGATIKLCEYLKIPLDPTFPGFTIPPGRSSFLKGQKGVQIVDSTYNANYDSMTAILEMYNTIPTKRKRWIVLADMVEQGSVEQTEHERLAKYVTTHGTYGRIILMGPRMRKYASPIVKKSFPHTPLTVFDTPKEVLVELQKSLTGNELLLCKGGRFLEGVVEHLLADPNDVENLCRQEAAWKKIRKEWGV